MRGNPLGKKRELKPEKKGTTQKRRKEGGVRKRQQGKGSKWNGENDEDQDSTND